MSALARVVEEEALASEEDLAASMVEKDATPVSEPANS